ncbi:MAG: ABC transporter substrate-binding protein [Alphaproteobacteria bacterium]|nr:ABC transporter substrate-binding protein [Alphaproteobacteria bacterium]
MKKKLLIIIGIIAIAAVAFFAFRPARESADPRPVVKIGATLPLTGNLASIGSVIRESLLMAQAEIPANSKYRYELIFEDDQYDMKKIVLNTTRLISAKNADAMLFMFDGSNIGAPVIEKHQIPGMGCTWGAKFFKDYEYSFNHWSRPATQAAAFVSLMKDRGIKTISSIAQNSANITELMDEVEKLAAKNGIKFTSMNLVNINEKDFRLVIEKMRAQKPDLVMLMLLDPQMTIFAKQAAEQNLNIPYTSIDEIANTPNRDYLEGSVFVSSISGSPEFQSRLADRTDLHIMPCTANLYDNFKILVSIYESADHKLTGPEVKDRLYQIKDYPSALGVKISVDKDGIIDSPLIRVRIENGQVVRM